MIFRKKSKKYLKIIYFRKYFNFHLIFYTDIFDSNKLSSIKGEAEVRNIALSPLALQDLLNLPTWLRINSARVNSVSLKIQWMQIQKVPIRISFDQVSLEAEALNEPRSPNGPSPIQELSSSGFLIHVLNIG